MKKKFIIIGIFIVINCCQINVFAAQEKFAVYLSLDKEVFVATEPVEINFIVKNVTSTIQKFTLYDVFYSSFQPVVLDIEGRNIENIVPSQLKGLSTKQIIKGQVAREIAIAPNETFTYKVDLQNCYKLLADKRYRVKGFFYPQLPQAKYISSNVEYFKIIPGFQKKSMIESWHIARGISPAEVVTLFLNAEKENQWENYLKFVKLESFIMAYPIYAQPYLKAENDSVKQQQVLYAFSRYLTKQKNEYLIDFKIKNEIVKENQNIAYVSVRVERYSPDKPYVYKYKYQLVKYNDYWLISDVQVSVGR